MIKGLNMFKVIEVDEKNKDHLIKQLRSDLLHNLFVIYDLLCEPEKTTMYAAYGNDGSLRAHLLIYKGFTMLPLAGRLDGEKKPARKLLEFLPSESIVLFCPPSLLNIVKEKFSKAYCYPEYQMYVARNKERLIAPNIAKRLKPDYASQLAELYSSGEPQFTRSEKRCRELLQKQRAYGVIVGDKLASVAVTVERLPEAWEITGVFTHPNYRGRGFAAMATSAATEEALKHANGVSLYVRSDNLPAIKVYEKLGYEKIDEWYWIDVGTGLKP